MAMDPFLLLANIRSFILRSIRASTYWQASISSTYRACLPPTLTSTCEHGEHAVAERGVCVVRSMSLFVFQVTGLRDTLQT